MEKPIKKGRFAKIMKIFQKKNKMEERKQEQQSLIIEEERKAGFEEEGPIEEERKTKNFTQEVINFVEKACEKLYKNAIMMPNDMRAFIKISYKYL